MRFVVALAVTACPRCTRNYTVGEFERLAELGDAGVRVCMCGAELPPLGPNVRQEWLTEEDYRRLYPDGTRRGVAVPQTPRERFDALLAELAGAFWRLLGRLFPER